MIATDTEVLARLRLVQGRSTAVVREFGKMRGRTLLLTVGADAQCDWCVQDHGVLPVHFSMHWDGAKLSIADTHGAGNIRVDGALLGSEWRRLGGRERIEFGAAALIAELPNAEVGAPTPSKRVPATTLSFGAPIDLPAQPQRPLATMPTAEAEVWSPPSYGHAPTSVVLHGRDDSGARGAQADARAYAASAEVPPRIPGAVVVLSPLTGGAEQGPESPRQASSAAGSERPLASWRDVSLSVVGVVVGYAAWLYLLYHL